MAMNLQMPGLNFLNTPSIPQPETLNPKPSKTPIVQPCKGPKPRAFDFHSLGTLNPKPLTLNPKAQTLSPKPLALNPKPQTLNPKPQTRNRKPQTPNPKPHRGWLACCRTRSTKSPTWRSKHPWTCVPGMKNIQGP